MLRWCDRNLEPNSPDPSDSAATRTWRNFARRIVGLLLWRSSRKIRKLPASMNFPFIALFVAQSALSNYWHKAADRTFSGIYHLNTFDLMMMIPYFIVL